jgi:hypothetical protein
VNAEDSYVWETKELERIGIKALVKGTAAEEEYESRVELIVECEME